MNIEIVFVTPDSESLVTRQLKAGATVADAITAANLAIAHPGIQFDELAAGVWGNPVSRDQRLKEGDRVEIYRELERDPMEARRLRALD